MRTKYSDFSFGGYQYASTFHIPEETEELFPLLDVLGDGRIVSTDGKFVYLETALRSRVFNRLRPLSAGYSAYIRVAPNGTKVAVDDGGTLRVFDVATPLSETTVALGGYDAEWVDNFRLAVSRNGIEVLDVATSQVKVAVNDIGGFNSGVTFDDNLRLYCGNGGDQVAGGSKTGYIKAYGKAIWEAALASGHAIDFEMTGQLVADILSAGYLGFDGCGNLYVGGGVQFGSSGDVSDPSAPADKGYAIIISKIAIQRALEGGPPVTPNSPRSDIQEFDPDPSSDTDFYYVVANRITRELYLIDYAPSGPTSGVVNVFEQH
jgi:hypothetical protein